MTLYLDKYGILLNGEASDGLLVLRHPTSPNDYGLQINRSEDYTGPHPQFVNLWCVTSRPTFTSKLRLIYQLAMWVFTRTYANPTQNA